VFLGLALLHRYSNKREGTRFADLYDLIDEREQRQAEILGKAMRFGAMLWMTQDAERGTLQWFPKKKLLQLRLTRDMVPLFGEVAEARFMSLASSMEAEVDIRPTR
jgi:exopolyphosphatase/guanosine-5'-triphosphate,3'-diphosphate pyrophosphatase